MKDLKNNLTTSGKGSTNIQSKRTKGFGYQVLGFGAGGGVIGPQFTIATGGTITECGDFKIHTFTGPGTFCVSQAGNPVPGCTPAGGPGNVDYLAVAGGGAGNRCGGAGGGAGGYRFTDGTSSGCYSAGPAPLGASGFPISAGAFPITVGGGGAASPAQCIGCLKGSDSIFSTITSTGGGGGGNGYNMTSASSTAGAPGGSGGGGGGNYPSSPEFFVAGTGNSPPVSPSQGNPGGTGAADSTRPQETGGGGGAGAVGSNATLNTQPGAGGTGLASSITASAVTRAGGGGGGSWSPDNWGPGNPGSSGGSGGGGAGGRGGCCEAVGAAGTPNTGSGGGGGGRAYARTGKLGGAGGSGIVVIRYKFQ